MRGEAVVRRAAGSRGLEEARTSRRPAAGRWCRVLRPAALRRARPSRTYADRRRYSAQCLLPSPLVQLVHAADDGVALMNGARERLRGRHRQAQGQQVRAGPALASWLKVKPTQTADFVVGGYTKGKGSREPLGALLVGYWKGRVSLRRTRRLGFRRRTLTQGLSVWRTRKRPRTRSPRTGDAQSDHGSSRSSSPK